MKPQSTNLLILFTALVMLIVACINGSGDISSGIGDKIATAPEEKIFVGNTNLGEVVQGPPMHGESQATHLSVNMTPKAASRRVLDEIRAAENDPALRGRYRQAIPFGTALFPGDDELRAFEPSSDGEGRALSQWLALPDQERRHDLLIMPDVDFYWKSDYKFNNQPADFTAQFILHFAEHSEQKTTISVVQLRSKVRLGKKFELLGRTGPGRYWDIRPVAPSPQANEEMIAFLSRALEAQRK